MTHNVTALQKFNELKILVEPSLFHATDKPFACIMFNFFKEIKHFHWMTDMAKSWLKET